MIRRKCARPGASTVQHKTPGATRPKPQRNNISSSDSTSSGPVDFLRSSSSASIRFKGGALQQKNGVGLSPTPSSGGWPASPSLRFGEKSRASFDSLRINFSPCSSHQPFNKKNGVGLSPTPSLGGWPARARTWTLLNQNQTCCQLHHGSIIPHKVLQK